MEGIFTSEALVALLTLTVMEIVLGVDNVIFISILAGKLPAEQQKLARQVGLGLALVSRLLLLLSISWIISLKDPFASLFGVELTGQNLILLTGGLFLIYKATTEIHDKLEGVEHTAGTAGKVTFSGVITQIILLDVVFSIDSVITAVGMASQLWVMTTAVVIAVVIMLFLAESVAGFVNRHPTVKMLALSFLLLIGFTLVVEGVGQHIEKGYIYFAMGFSVLVEVLNLRMSSKKGKPVQLHQQITDGPTH